MVIRAPVLETTACPQCDALRAELDVARRRIAELETETEALRRQLREVLKVVDLQKADLDRLRDEEERTRPNRPERAPDREMQLAFERVVATFGDIAPANDAPAAEQPPGPDDDAAAASSDETREPDGNKPVKRRDPHGRRRLDLAQLPVEILQVDPDEVRAVDGKGFKHVGDEIAERIAYKPAQFVRLRLVRRKFVAIEDDAAAATQTDVTPLPPVLVAPLPDSLWPRMMADPSAIAHVIVSKYDDVLPLHRQERISLRSGFMLPRSTQCGWLGAGHDVCYRVVDAMFAEAKVSVRS